MTSDMFELDAFDEDNWEVSDLRNTGADQRISEHSSSKVEGSWSPAEIRTGTSYNPDKHSFFALEQLDYSGKMLVEILERELHGK